MREARRSGAGEYIKKPYRLNLIGRALKKTLRKDFGNPVSQFQVGLGKFFYNFVWIMGGFDKVRRPGHSFQPFTRQDIPASTPLSPKLPKLLA